MQLSDFIPHTRTEKATCVAAGIIAATAITVTAILSWRKPDELPQVPVYAAHAPTVPADTDANRALRAFPEHIDGAEKIEKFEIPGARTVFVHIRQVHHIEEILARLQEHFEDEEPARVTQLRQQVSMIINVQENIEKILRSLSAHGLLKIFSPEGFLAGKTETTQGYRAWSQLNVLPGLVARQTIQDARPVDVQIADHFAAIQKGASRLLGHTLSLWETELLCYGGAYRALADIDVRPVGNETFEQNLKATLLPALSADYTARMDVRENALLEAAVTAAQTGPQANLFAVGIMGGGHDFLGQKTAQDATWSNASYQEHYEYNNFNAPQNTLYTTNKDDDRVMYNAQYFISAIKIQDKKNPEQWNWFGNQDNVALWNHNHPDKKISIIVITPQGYRVP